MAGTTRDIIETFLNIGGFPILLTDTAGNRTIDSSVDPVEVAGIHRARETTEGVRQKLKLKDLFIKLGNYGASASRLCPLAPAPGRKKCTHTTLISVKNGV